jgi:hypothetical protein
MERSMKRTSSTSSAREVLCLLTMARSVEKGSSEVEEERLDARVNAGSIT